MSRPFAARALPVAVLVASIARAASSEPAAPAPASSPPPAPTPFARSLQHDASSPEATGTYGDRTRELLDYRCSNDLGLREVTLFANGTVRLRDGLGKKPRMRLGELGPVELAGYLRRLDAEDLSEVHDRQESTEGAWVERCTLRLALIGKGERLISFSRFDSLPLALGAVVHVADEMAQRTLSANDLPVGYRARPGDVLRRADGVLFEVVGFTSDKQGLELRGREQPLTLYLRPEDLPSLFEALVSRRSP